MPLFLVDVLVCFVSVQASQVLWSLVRAGVAVASGPQGMEDRNVLNRRKEKASGAKAEHSRTHQWMKNIPWACLQALLGVWVGGRGIPSAWPHCWHSRFSGHQWQPCHPKARAAPSLGIPEGWNSPASQSISPWVPQLLLSPDQTQEKHEKAWGPLSQGQAWQG